MPEDDTVEGDGDDADDQASGDDQAGLLTRLEAMDTERWAEAIVTGAVTYVVGYLVMVAVIFLGPANPGASASLREKLGFVGIVFNAAHNIDVQSSHEILLFTGDGRMFLGQTFDLFRFVRIVGEQSVPTTVYFAVPVTLLIAVGFSRAWRLSPADDIWDPVKTTTGLSIGYGALAYLGTYIYRYPFGTADGGQSFAVLYTVPSQTLVRNNTTTVTVQGAGRYTFNGVIESNIADIVLTSSPTSALLFGILFPLVIATFGALLAVSIQQRRAGDGDDTPGE